MRIPIVAILTLAPLGLAFPLDAKDAMAHPALEDLVSRDLNVDISNRQVESNPEDKGVVTSLDLRSPNAAENALATLENRNPVGWCYRNSVGRLPVRYRNLQAFNTYWGYGNAVAGSICLAIDAGPACYGAVVALALVTAAVLKIENTHAGHENPALGFDAITNSIAAIRGAVMGDDVAARSLPALDYHDNLVRGLSEADIDYDSVEHLDIPALKHQKRSIDAPDLTHRTMIRGVKAENVTHDFALNRYSNGHAAIHLSLPNEQLASDPTSELGKRKTVDHVGWKISYAPRRTINVDKAGLETLSRGIAKHWAETAFSQTGWGDYYGVVHEDGDANVYFRISAEKAGFNLDVDDVDACGGQAWALTA